MIQVRDHLSEKFSRARLTLELSRAVRPSMILAFGYLVAFGCVAFVVSNVARTLYLPTQTVSFEVDSARAVQPNVQEVKVLGIPAGQISKVELKNGRAVITAKVEKKYGPIFRNARATLRPQTVLQDMFLDVTDRGQPSAGMATGDHPLPASQTLTSVNVAEVLQTFDVDTRARLGQLLRDLGGGFNARGNDLRTSFVQVMPFLKVAGRLSRQLTARSTMTRRLVHNTAILTGELARRDTEVRTLVSEGARTLGALGASSGDLESTIAELPPTLSAIDSSFTAVRGVLGDVDGALLALRPVAGELPGGLAALRRLSATGDPALARLQPPVHQLVPLAGSLKPLSQELRGAVLKLRPQTGALDHVTRTATGCLFAVQRFFQWTPSVFKMSDDRGVAPRAYVTTGLNGGAATKDPTVFAGKGCAPGAPIANTPGPGGKR